MRRGRDGFAAHPLFKFRPSPAPSKDSKMSEQTRPFGAYFSFRDRYRILHLSWLAFFVSFVVWFNHAPLMASIRPVFARRDRL